MKKIIPFRSAASAQAKVVGIRIEKIRESIVTLRTEYDPEKLGELSDSIDKQGQLQMIVVQETDGGFYELIIGSRRLRAAKLKGYDEIMAAVIDQQTPSEMLILALAENLHRADLNPFEEARAFLRLMKEYGLEAQVIATRINKPDAYVRGRLQLLSMPEKVIAMVSSGKLPLNQIRSLVRLTDGDSQVRLAELAVKNRLNQGELNAAVSKELRSPAIRRVSRNTLTPLKVTAKVNQFLEFLRTVPKVMEMDSMNAVERRELLCSLRLLGAEAGTVQNSVLSRSVSAVYRPAPNNQGSEWTTGDLQAIVDPKRPSDEVLARQLGRSVAAIRSMRSSVSVAG
jgi:ParB family chromosome partitioning protein